MSALMHTVRDVSIFLVVAAVGSHLWFSNEATAAQLAAPGGHGCHCFTNKSNKCGSKAGQACPEWFVYYTCDASKPQYECATANAACDDNRCTGATNEFCGGSL